MSQEMGLARVIVVDDEKTIRESVSLFLEHNGFEVDRVSCGEDAKTGIDRNSYDLALVDLKLGDASGLEILRLIKEKTPLTEVIIITAYGTIESAVQAIKEGAYDYITKPFRSQDLKLVVNRALEKKSLVDRVRSLEKQLREKYKFEKIIGSSSGIIEVLKKASQVAHIDSTVLIRGESGTGKELVVRAIHFNSPRSSGPFIILNCAAVPDSLQESELFGHVKGAFTGAHRDKKGLLEAAHRGTVFLDEVGELSMPAQAKLLRFLQEGEVRRIGSITTTLVDVRVLSSTNRDLSDMVKSGKFREDLFYRLNVIEIVIPPLRARIDDIALLVKYFIDHYSKKLQSCPRRISRRAMSILESYHWPGNVRELENVIERACVLSTTDSIKPEDLPEQVLNRGRFEQEGEKLETLSQLEKEHIKKVLSINGGNRAKVARVLGIAPSTLWRKMKIYGIDRG